MTCNISEIDTSYDTSDFPAYARILSPSKVRARDGIMIDGSEDLNSLHETSGQKAL